ncbi:MAG: DUF3014 domain-containing protein [Acidimicrobiia bacterium]|nr:DUF3014 domain-containing protein [Acidimicrobiia bacterium]
MTNLSEFDVDAPLPEPPQRHERERSPIVWVIAAIAVLALGGGVYYWLTRPAADAGTTTEATVPAARPAAPAEPPIEVPPLADSDPVVRKLIAALSAHPLIARWLTTNGLIRNMAVVVENIAYGALPSAHLQPLRPAGPFRVLDRGGQIVADPRNYARFDGIADAVASVDAAGAAKLYRGLTPRLQEAYADLGRQEPFDDALRKAINLLLEVPVPAGNIRLEPESAVEYRYADPSLQRLSPAQKQLLRMGPRNIPLIQGKLRDFLAVLERG